MGNTFGTLFRISTWGESHGAGIGVVVDGCPPRLPLTAEDLQHDLDRRRPGQSRLTTQRAEADRVEILSGIFEGRTTGGPVAVLVRNDDARSGAYDHLKDLYRPSHADFTYDAKYGNRDWRGGGRSSARETIGRVAAGAIARRLLAEVAGIEVLGWVSRIWPMWPKIAGSISAVLLVLVLVLRLLRQRLRLQLGLRLHCLHCLHSLRRIPYHPKCISEFLILAMHKF